MAAGVVDFNSIVGTVSDAFKGVWNTVNPPVAPPPPKSTIGAGLGLTPGGVKGTLSSTNIGAPTLILGALAIIIVVGVFLVRR